MDKKFPKSMRLMGNIQGQPMLILVDSSSSHSFLSVTLAKKISWVSPLPQVLSVKVANGNNIQCQWLFLNAAWEVKGC
jgi:hypothetical protein